MTVFLQFLENWVAKLMTKPFSVPIGGDEDTQSNITTKEFDVNTKAHYVGSKVHHSSFDDD